MADRPPAWNSSAVDAVRAAHRPVGGRRERVGLPHARGGTDRALGIEQVSAVRGKH